ncbi:hypothetical protein [Sphingobacterium sp. UBA5670]|uniref:hypothetical protein n=1 Tax=Sphingobacterium sp. UBA5670 TaxID=1947502 RepID=UPI0025D42ACB|nr:hypothetical protein [Sphingobacterium sp. UBA5670]
MKLFQYIDRINLLDKLIRQRRTGTPIELSKRLGISVSRLYAMMDELRGRGAPIEYSRQDYTYYYTYEFMISISLKMEALGDDKLRYISGGEKFFSTILFTTVFVE